MSSSDTPCNVLMLKLPRTGSTFVAHLLDAHEQIEFRAELLNPLRKQETAVLNGWVGRLRLKRFVRRRYLEKKTRTLREFLAASGHSRIAGASLNPFKEGLKAEHLKAAINGRTRVISLTRDNLLKQYISHLNVRSERQAGAPRPYKSYNATGAPTRRTFVIGEEAVDEVRRLENLRGGLEEIVQQLDVPVLHLTYDHDVNALDKRPLIEKLAGFIGVDVPEAWRSILDGRPAATPYHKLVGDDLREVIENYEDAARNPVLARYI